MCAKIYRIQILIQEVTSRRGQKKKYTEVKEYKKLNTLTADGRLRISGFSFSFLFHVHEHRIAVLFIVKFFCRALRAFPGPSGL